MKLLVIICGHEFNIVNSENVKILNNFMVNFSEGNVEYCGISNNDDFHNYENIISFKYKVINPKRQFSKICDFITKYKSELNYDWFIKTRPDLKIIDMFDFNTFSDKAINARARMYVGPKKIKYGMSVNGEGRFKNIGDCAYDEREKEVRLDDCFFMFHNNVVQLGAFEPYPTIEIKGADEYYQTRTWIERGIPLNVIGFHIEITTYGVFSGHLNM
jgi:hypothetical protein